MNQFSAWERRANAGKVRGRWAALTATVRCTAIANNIAILRRETASINSRNHVSGAPLDSSIPKCLAFQTSILDTKQYWWPVIRRINFALLYEKCLLCGSNYRRIQISVDRDNTNQAIHQTIRNGILLFNTMLGSYSKEADSLFSQRGRKQMKKLKIFRNFQVTATRWPHLHCRP